MSVDIRLIGKDYTADELKYVAIDPVTKAVLVKEISPPPEIPSGVIVMWSGTLATIPSGWALCNGTGGTPDLRDKFICGCADGVDPGGTGGSHTRVLTEANLPSHTHGAGTLGADSVANHQHSYEDYYTENQGLLTEQGTWGTHWALGVDHSRTTGAAGTHTHTTSGATAATGSGASFDNRPAYYALAFIQKT